MIRSCRLPLCLAALGFISGSLAAQPEAKGLGDPGVLQSLTVDCGRARGGAIVLSGRDSGQQLVVTGQYSSGQVRDWTSRVRYTTAPAGILKVDETGYVSALKEGSATLSVDGPDRLKATIRIQTTNIDRDAPLHFANDIVPILTRFGCNAGGCHGKSGGQNGFSLSLLGFEPDEDFEFIVKENRGRRLFPASPARSLLVQKATGQVPHGGGRKIDPDSPFDRILIRWIEQGAPHGAAEDATVVRIEVFPKNRLLERGAPQQLAVVAHLSDGSTRDVTRLAQFEANDADIASVSESGLVATKSTPGTVAVMARFQSHVDTFQAIVPLGAPVASLPKANNFIDELVFAQLKRLGLPPSPTCDDATFLRRVTVDLAGRLPTLEETKAFLADADDAKRSKAIERLLASPDYADYFALKWSAVLRNKRQSAKEDAAPTKAFHAWIHKSFQENKPFDKFVREILTATGDDNQNPAVVWYREVNEPTAQVEDTAQLFLGTRLQCARCHHHPLEKWSQQDYYGLAAFFSQVSNEAKVELKKGAKAKDNKKPTKIVHKTGVAAMVNPRSGQSVAPTPLGGISVQVAADVDPRGKLVDWIVDPSNVLFSRALANRMWKHFLGRGLVEAEDDLRATNPPTNPELLEALAKHVVDAKFDLKALIRAICNSTTYQLSSEPNAFNGSDKQNYARFQPRRLPAEVLHDAIDQVTLAKSEFPGAPAGTRAVQLPDNAFESYFLAVFGRPDMSSACECERSSDVNLSQMLHLMNSFEVLMKIGGKAPQVKSTEMKSEKSKAPKTANKTRVTPGERLNKLVSDKRGHDEKLRELYLFTYGRLPTDEELSLLRGHIERTADVRNAYEDILWVMLNSEDFLFNH